MKKKLPIILLGVILACVLVFGFLYANNDIGKTANSLEADIRQSQKILDDWIVDGSISDTMAAFISYPQDKTDHTFSVYVNRPGLSFGYFFRGGGDIVEVDDYIAEFVVEGNNERAFISMNTQNIVRLEVDDGNGIQVIDIDSGKPFAIVLPLNVGNIAQATGCAIVLIGHLNKAAGTQSTYRGLGSIDITAAVRSLLFIGKLKDSPTTRVLIHEKSSLAPPGQSLAFSLGDEKGFEWIGAYDITADELLAGTDTAKTESKTAQAQMLILELLADGKRMPSAELEKAVNEHGISSRTMRTAKSRIGDRLVTEKDSTAWVCYLRN